MYIKKIEIIKFRSLSNVVLEFSDSINTITGDNGLGKSAILDAIRFILFKRDENFAVQGNYSFIDENGEIIQKYPRIVLYIQFNNKQIAFKTDNNKWFIDGTEYKDFSNYSNEVLKIFKFNNLELFFSFINPFFIRNALAKPKDLSIDKKQVRDSIIAIIIAQDPTQKENFNIMQKNNNELENIAEKIRILNQNKKLIEQNISSLINNNGNITSWNLSEADLVDGKKANELNQKITKFKQLDQEVEVLIQKIKTSNQEIFVFQQQKEKASQTNNVNVVKKTNKIILFFLFVFTFGFYYFYWKKNSKKTDNYALKNVDKINGAITRLEIEKKEYEKKLKAIRDDDFFVNFDYEDSLKQLESIEQLQNQSNQNRRIVAQHNQLKKQLDESINGINMLNLKINQIDEQNNVIALSATKILKEKLKTFTIELFNKKDDQALIIRKNGIEWKYLNSSSKNNVLIELNDLLKNNTNVNTFSLIDNAESINEIFWDNNSQQIITKVTKEKGLVLNGKNIN